MWGKNGVLTTRKGRWAATSWEGGKGAEERR